jgi:uncharacterized membrane protein
MFSGPFAALKRSCNFEVFVEVVDRMNSSMAPALTVLLPAAFLSLCLSALMTLGGFSKLFFLNMAALLLFSGALVATIVFEVPLVRQIATWPTSLTVTDDWQVVRKRWLWIHFVRVAFGFASLILLLVASGLQAFEALRR